jgi:hypothetical protein
MYANDLLVVADLTIRDILALAATPEDDGRPESRRDDVKCRNRLEKDRVRKYVPVSGRSRSLGRNNRECRAGHPH